MKNSKTHLAVLLLSTLGLFTGAYGQVIPRGDAATLNQVRPTQNQPATSGPMVQEQETVLYTFTGLADGGFPGGLIRDGAGNLYGTTWTGTGGGVVFKLDSMGNETVLHTFTGPPDGATYYESAGLVTDNDGNLYGTTDGGGSASGAAGTVFKLAPPAQPGGAWTETVLYSFTGGTDGNSPQAGLVRDDKGNLYGTTPYGGEFCSSPVNYGGCGVVFMVDRAGKETVLYNFCPNGQSVYGSCPDGLYPTAALIQDAAGNLYSTTQLGGAYGQGTVFKLAPPAQPGGAWTETVLHSFAGGTDGGTSNGESNANVIRDSDGNLYGTTDGGGTWDAGVVFKLAPPAQEGGTWTETVLHTFTGGTDGGIPLAGLILDVAGNLYGTTLFGGLDSPYCQFYCGVVFKLDTAGNETALYSFTGFADGENPASGLVQDTAGNLYGTTYSGGDFTQCNGFGGCGVVFKLAPAGVSVFPTSLNFGNVWLGHRAKQVVTLENQGIDSVEIGPITFTVTTGDASQFSLGHVCPASIGAGKSCTIAVIFTPDAAGTDAATLNIVTSAPGSPIEVPITAAGKEQ